MKRTLYGTLYATRESELNHFVKHYEAISQDGIDRAMRVDGQEMSLEIHDGVAVIPVDGTLSKSVAVWENILCGLVDVDDVGYLIDQAVASPDVKSIVLRFDSPGGSVAGIPELAAKIRLAREQKPILAFSDTLCASAAYWLASQCHAIYGTISASFGSVGVFTLLQDSSKLFENAGIRPVLVKAGEYKGIAADGLAITDPQIARIQESIDYVYSLFTRDVNSGRPAPVGTSAMQGLDYFSEVAKTKGLIDEIVSNENEVVEMAKQLSP